MSYARSESTAPNPDTVIWRYMDDWKFKVLLETFSEHDQWQPTTGSTRTVHRNDPGQLWFGFPKSFDDSKEGTFPDPNEDPETYCDQATKYMRLSEDAARSLKEQFLKTDSTTLRDTIFFMAQLCGVSCWHANDDESSAMWNDFVGMKNGVAIRSTCKDVEHAMAYAHNSPAKKASPSVCAVGYVDHADYFLPSDGFRGLLSIIQESFSHENEVRFVAKSAALAAISTKITTPLPLDPANWRAVESVWAANKDQYLAEIAAQARQTYQCISQSKTQGFHLPIALKDLMLEVVLKPGCDCDYESTVRQQLKVVGCDQVQVRRSSRE